MTNTISRRKVLQYSSLIGAGAALSAIFRALPTSARTKDYGDEFINKGRKHLLLVRESEIEHIERAADMAASSLATGKKIYSEVTIGHMMFQETRNERIGNPKLFTTLPQWMGNSADEYLKMQKGDFFITNYPYQHCLDAHKRGVLVTGVTSPFVPDEKSAAYVNPWAEGYYIKQVSDLVIECKTPHTEGIVNVTEVPEIALFPGSELTLALIYWMVNAELANKVTNGHKARPKEKAKEYFEILMGRYDEAALQIAEIKHAAQIAAERVINGAKFYVYDQKGELTSEACNRASGLMLTQRTNAKLNNVKYGDILVLGAYSSDDPLDIEVAKRAREKGVLIVGIGPLGMEGNSSGERTLKHVNLPLDNYSWDSWGCVSIKGMERKICPTSGITSAMLFWTFQAQMVTEMLKKGEVPYVWMGVHMKEGRDYNNVIRSLFLKRGY